jgi:ribokinase
LILVDEQGENLISVASGANHALSPEDVENAAQRIGLADAVMLQLEIPLQTVERVANLTAEANVPLILDPAPAPDAPLNNELLAQITYLTPNESEAKRLTGIEVIDRDSARAAAAKLLEAGPTHVIITLGANGVLVAGPDGVDFVPGHTVDAVDTTAAGDAFNGGLAVALARRLPLDEAVCYANHVGALSVTRMGAQPSLPTYADVCHFVGKNPLPGKSSA